MVALMLGVAVRPVIAVGVADAIGALRCDDAVTPLGIDDTAPRFAWQMVSQRQGASQAAYEILVATSEAALKVGKADAWDSGKVASAISVQVAYGGAALQARERYFWLVKVWNEAGVEVDSPSSWFEMGLMGERDWHAKWISDDTKVAQGNRAVDARWITVPKTAVTKENAASPDAQFRMRFSLAEKPVSAELLITGRDNVGAWVNDAEVVAERAKNPSIDGWPWGTFRKADVSGAVRAGENVLAAEVTSEKNSHEPGTLLALLIATMPDGSVVRIKSDAEWKVTKGAHGAWHDAGYKDSGWVSAVVEGKIGDATHGSPWPLEPAGLYRKSFEAHAGVKSARLYSVALGSYIPYLNGKRVGSEVLAPGWTDYRDVLAYQTYDVTDLVASGANAVGVMLGDGWYASGMVNSQRRFAFGPPPLRFKVQLEIKYKDGTKQTIASDESWVTRKSPIVKSDIYNGEDYDARLEDKTWDTAKESVAGWGAVTVADAPDAAVKIVAQNYPPIAVEKTLKPVSIKETGPGVFLVDMGQNMVGGERISARGTSGQTVKLQFGEVLNADGTFYRENMRGAREEDDFTLKGGAMETFEPSFTYHGYRYIQVSNYPGKLKVEDISGVVFHTDAPFTMAFHTSNALIDKLVTNILWGQRGNFMSVPTDCPQRDERLGWTGDANAFWRTASYNMDLDSFSRKFAKDMQIAQTSDGEFTDIAPRVLDTAGAGTPGWADAGITIPWTAYEQYGDTKILEQSWESMSRYMESLKTHYPTYISDHKGYGDWLAIGSDTPKDLIATVFWSYDAMRMYHVGKVLGKDEDAKEYWELNEKIRTAFQKKFISADGVVGSGSQTSDVLALWADLVPVELRAKVADALVADIKAHDNHLTTGFLGTPHLMQVLTETGHQDVAFGLLMQDTYPSWEYMIKHGATTMWERWNGDQMLSDATMNSFNHYAYGAVAEWLYREVAGIDAEADDPGFHNIVMRPHFDSRLGDVSATYQSPYGTIQSEWKYTGKEVAWTVVIPANTTASIYLPGKEVQKVVAGAYHFTVQP